MRVDIVPIGNSQGIRLPKSIIEQCGFQKTVEMEIVDHKLVIQSSHQVRRGWKEAFSSKVSEPGDHLEELQALSNQWDEEEWQW